MTVLTASWITAVARAVLVWLVLPAPWTTAVASVWLGLLVTIILELLTAVASAMLAIILELLTAVASARLVSLVTYLLRVFDSGQCTDGGLFRPHSGLFARP